MDGNGAPKKQGIIQPALGVLAALGALLAYVAVLAVVTIIFDLGVRTAHPNAGAEEIKEISFGLATLSGIVGNAVAVGLLAAVILIMKKRLAPSLSLKKFSPLALVPCIVLGAAFNFFSECAISLIPFPESVIDTYRELYSYLGRGNAVLEIIGVVVITPIAEELFFRGVAYRLMRKKSSAALSVALSSVLFGLAHGNALSFVYTVPLGVILAVSFEAHGSIFVPVLIHASFNAASYLIGRVMNDPSKAALASTAAAAAAVSALALFALIKISKKHKNNSQSPQGTGTE